MEKGGFGQVVLAGDAKCGCEKIEDVMRRRKGTGRKVRD